MDDFIIQVLATLVSSLIIFLIGYIFKKLKKISIQTWLNILFCLFTFCLYLFNVNVFIMNLRSIIEPTNFTIYLVKLTSLSISFFSTIDLSIFVSKNIIHKKS